MVEHDDELFAAQEKIERLRRFLVDIKNRDVQGRSRAEPVLRKIKQRARDLLEFLEKTTGC